MTMTTPNSAEGDCPPTDCSPYVKTPVTNEAILMCQDEDLGDAYGYFHAVHADVAAKLEMERNEARLDASLFLQDLDHIKTMIEKGASTYDVLLFLDTPRCDNPEANAEVSHGDSAKKS